MTRQLVNVYLGGAAGRRFGTKWQLAVSSPAEAIRAIDVNTRGWFRRYLFNEGKHKYYKVGIGDKTKLIGLDEMSNRSGSCDIYIMPAIKGSNSGAGKIIAGVALVALAVFAPEIAVGLWGAGALGATAAGTSFAVGSIGYIGAGIAFSIGTSLVLGGISQLLAPHPQQQGELNSNSFQGTVSAVQQGGCVPVVYGKALVAPSPISISFTNTDYNTTQLQFTNDSTYTPVPGGGIQYSTPAPTPSPNNSDIIIVPGEPT